jgi:RNA polymerase sigma-70 factor (ECF subfamily)
MGRNAHAADLAAVFRAERRFLWALCYRLTGSAADADDLVQETFSRALARPPERTDAPWRPWLVRVALNLGRDLLRRRRRQPYRGPWLPAPIDTGDESSPPAHEPAVTGADGRPLTTEGRYDLLESVSFAFLLALEALTPRERAVLLLRDVFDYSVEDAAAVLDLSPANVKTTHHRARRAMRSYDRTRCVPTRERQERTRRALERFLAALASGDRPTVEALLAPDVRAVADAAGEAPAARVPVVGAARVAKLYANLAARYYRGGPLAWRMLNGLPALVAPGYVLRVDVDAEGRITTVHSILARRKLAGLRDCPPS